MKKKKMELKVSDGGPTLGYVYLPSNTRAYGAVDKIISLFDLIGKYEGPSIYLDFKNGELVGIEIVP